MDWIVSVFRQYPPLAIFLTLGLGFLVGKIKFGNFKLGSVTSVLLIGVLIGQLEIPVSGPIKMFFFMLFLFSIGYTVGPDFFKSLKGSGAKQALFAVLMSSTCFASTLFISYLFGYTKGETVGLFSGSQTCSSLLGVGSEAIQKLGLPADVASRELGIIPVCYAVTYIFGTLGTVIILGNFGPKLLGGMEKVKAKTAELDRKLTPGHRIYSNLRRQQHPARDMGSRCRADNTIGYMNIRRIFLPLLLLAAVCLPATAQKRPEVYIQTDLVSSYLWRGQRNAGVSLQPTLGLKWRGLHFYVWANEQLCPPSGQPVKHEIDFFLKYSITPYLTVGLKDVYVNTRGDGFFSFGSIPHAANGLDVLLAYDFKYVNLE